MPEFSGNPLYRIIIKFRVRISNPACPSSVGIPFLELWVNYRWGSLIILFYVLYWSGFFNHCATCINHKNLYWVQTISHRSFTNINPTLFIISCVEHDKRFQMHAKIICLSFGRFFWRILLLIFLFRLHVKNHSTVVWHAIYKQSFTS